jgi:hypothetical protein
MIILNQYQFGLIEAIIQRYRKIVKIKLISRVRYSIVDLIIVLIQITLI